METKEKSFGGTVQKTTFFNLFKSTKVISIQLEFLALQWLKNVKLKIKESSYVKYCNVVQNHILPDLGSFRLEQLTTGVVEEFVQKKLECGRKNGYGGLSAKTVKDILLILKEMCLYASCFDIEVPCHFELIKIRTCHTEIQVLDSQNYIALVQFLLGDNDLKKTGILLSLYLGLRLGEVCSLKRQHILYEEQILCVRTTMQRVQDLNGESEKKTKIIVTEPKSPSSIRDIPIPAFLMERLEVLRELSEDTYVLTGSSERFVEPRTLENILRRYLQECGMEYINYHALRHTFATKCVEKGFDIKSLSEILGHANVSITLNRYVHSSMEQKRKNMEKIFPCIKELAP